jgi:hypothetical protein
MAPVLDLCLELVAAGGGFGLSPDKLLPVEEDELDVVVVDGVPQSEGTLAYISSEQVGYLPPAATDRAAKPMAGGVSRKTEYMFLYEKYM